MAHIQYYTSVDWDTDMQDVGFSSTGLAINGSKKTAGVPSTPAGVWSPGAIVQNIGSGLCYYNSGTTAVPSWTQM